MAASWATAAPSPLSAIELELSIGTTDTPSGASWVKAAAISRAPLLSRPTTRVACASTSIRASTWRIRATLSAKSETTIELRLAVIEPSRPTIGRSVSTAAAGSMCRTRKISVTKPEALARRPTGARRRRAGDRLDPQRPARDRHRDEAVGAQRRQEQLEIFGARQRPLGHHRDPALHARIDDEGPPGHPRGVLDEGADVGVAQVEHVLRATPASRRRRPAPGQSKLASPVHPHSQAAPPAHPDRPSP